jgi:V8-like Glu-specific endopeptidase
VLRAAWFILSAVVAQLLLLAGQARGSEPDVGITTQPLIYGTDDRTDVSRTEWQAVAASSSVALVPVESLVYRGEWVDLTGAPLGSTLGLCSDEPFWEGRTVAKCSGVLIAPDLVLTAGHCFRGPSACKDLAIVFDYQSSQPEKVVRVSEHAVYGCREVVARGQPKSESERWHDFAIVRLDRPAGDRKPAKISHERWLPGEQVFVIGNPLGLPTLLDLGARTTFTDDAGKYSFVTADTYGGSSGSPVFDDERLLRAVVVAGREDFENLADGCRTSRRVQDAGQSGELAAYVDTAVRALCATGVARDTLCDDLPGCDQAWCSLATGPADADCAFHAVGHAHRGTRRTSLVILVALCSWCVRQRRRRDREVNRQS